jgi:hypothetical protein
MTDHYSDPKVTERMTGDQTVSLSALRRLIAHAAQGTQAA